MGLTSDVLEGMWDSITLYYAISVLQIKALKLSIRLTLKEFMNISS